MAHSQGTPREYRAYARVDVGTQQLTYNSTALLLNKGLRLSGGSGTLTANSTAFISSIGIKISNAQTLTANSTGYISSAVAALPSTDEGAAFTIGSNSTGVFVAVNTTSTTWKYLQTTAAQPT